MYSVKLRYEKLIRMLHECDDPNILTDLSNFVTNCVHNADDIPDDPVRKILYLIEILEFFEEELGGSQKGEVAD